MIFASRLRSPFRGRLSHSRFPVNTKPTRPARGRYRAAKIATAALGLAFPSVGSAGVIAGTQINFAMFPTTDGVGANCGGFILETPTGPGPGLSFAYTGTTLAFRLAELTADSDWYIANAGDVFSAETIAAGHLPILYAPPVIAPPLDIPLGDFYLAISTTDFDLPYPPGGGNVFGWLELNNTGTELVAVANAVDYGDGGIIVGTTTPAPEPASLLVLVGGLALLAVLRRN